MPELSNFDRRCKMAGEMAGATVEVHKLGTVDPVTVPDCRYLPLPEYGVALLDRRAKPAAPTSMGVASMVFRDGFREVLLQHHIESDLWEFPGGKVDTGEQLDAAVVRERQEECGLYGPAGRFCGVRCHYGRDPARKWWATAFYYSALVELQGEPRVCEPTKFHDVRFFPVGALPANLSPLVPIGLDLVRGS